MGITERLLDEVASTMEEFIDVGMTPEEARYYATHYVLNKQHQQSYDGTTEGE